MGIPLLMPWIIYKNHIEHHSVRYFGTPDDGEYLPLAAAPPHETIKYVLQAPLLPLLTVLRFGVVGPLSWLHRGLREWVLTAASAGVSNPYFRKRFPAADEWHLRIVEVLCFLWLLALAVLVATGHDRLDGAAQGLCADRTDPGAELGAQPGGAQLLATAASA